MAYNKQSNAKSTKQSKTEVKQTWNEITGTMRIFGNEFKSKRGTFVKWSATISKKGDNDEYINFYLPVRFAGKDSNEPEEIGLQTIEINHAFLSIETYRNKNGDEVTTPVIVVIDNKVSEDLPY